MGKGSFGEVYVLDRLHSKIDGKFEIISIYDIVNISFIDFKDLDINSYPNTVIKF